MDKEVKRDYDKFYVNEPDSDFSPEHNDYVINISIKKYEASRRKKDKAYEEQIRERVDAVTDYLIACSRSDIPVEKYFGRQELARLRGEKLVQRLKNGRVYFE